MDRSEIAWSQRIESEIHDDRITLAKTAARLENVAMDLSKIALRLEEIKHEKKVSTSNLRR